MFATCFGATRGASSITTRPPGSSMYSVLSGSGERQSCAGEPDNSSGTVTGFATALDGTYRPSAIERAAAVYLIIVMPGRGWLSVDAIGEPMYFMPRDILPYQLNLW